MWYQTERILSVGQVLTNSVKVASAPLKKITSGSKFLRYSLFKLDHQFALLAAFCKAFFYQKIVRWTVTAVNHLLLLLEYSDNSTPCTVWKIEPRRWFFVFLLSFVRSFVKKKGYGHICLIIGMFSSDLVYVLKIKTSKAHDNCKLWFMVTLLYGPIYTTSVCIYTANLTLSVWLLCMYNFVSLNDLNNARWCALFMDVGKA